MTRISLIVCFLVAFAGCGNDTNRLQEGTQSNSQVAPDGLGRSFIWLPKGTNTLGATNSQPYEVWVENLQGEKSQMLVLKADATDGVAIAWKGARELEICYGPSHIYYFNNLFDHADQKSRQLYRVEVHLRQVQSLLECK
jgi:hypothetical protein